MADSSVNIKTIEEQYKARLGKAYAKDAEFNEADHPRDDSGKFGSGYSSSSGVENIIATGNRLAEKQKNRPDTAAINIPGHTKNLAAEASRHVEQARVTRNKELTESHKASIEKANPAKEQFKEHRKELLGYYSKRLGKSFPEVESAFKDIIRRNPEMFMRMLEKFKSETQG
jgi:hypothetical protein